MTISRDDLAKIDAAIDQLTSIHNDIRDRTIIAQTVTMRQPIQQAVDNLNRIKNNKQALDSKVLQTCQEQLNQTVSAYNQYMSQNPPGTLIRTGRGRDCSHTEIKGNDSFQEMVSTAQTSLTDLQKIADSLGQKKDQASAILDSTTKSPYETNYREQGKIKIGVNRSTTLPQSDKKPTGPSKPG